MSDALTIAASGLKSESVYIDKIANDLANINTNNYKATQLTFEDVLYQDLNPGAPLFQNQNTPKIGLGTAIYKTTKDFSNGALKPTSNWNDLAIDGMGFFQIINTDGNIVYTRNSTFSLDADHYLATQDGLRLADNIQIPEDAVSIKIQKNGDVEATMSDDPEPQLLGTIQLAKFVNPEALNPVGAGLYMTTEQTGEAIVDNPGDHGLGVILQNQVESSNVDMTASLMQLTLAQRVYQLNAKTVQIADELEKMTNEIRS